MTPEKLNLKLRKIINDLLSDGHIKYNICSITFGTQRMDTLTKFINGHDLGIKPLSKLFEAFGYDLHISLIEKSNKKERDIVEKNTDKSLEEIKIIFNNFLDDSDNLNITKKSQNHIIDQVIQELIEKNS